MSVIQRLKSAISVELCYWTRPQNLGREAFKEIISKRTAEIERIKWEGLESPCRSHLHDEEDEAFSGHLTVKGLGTVRYYIKGCFFPKRSKHVNQGVMIQSFKKD